MTRLELLERIRALPEDAHTPITFELAVSLRLVRNERMHWIGWLEEYETPGYYKRRPVQRDAADIYKRIQCAPMLLWLAEAFGVPAMALHKAAQVCRGENGASDCAAVRRVLPWSYVRQWVRPPLVFLTGRIAQKPTTG